MKINSTHSIQKASSTGTGSTLNSASNGRVGTRNKPSGHLQIRQTDNPRLASDATSLSGEAKTGNSSAGRMSGLLSGLSEWGTQEAQASETETKQATEQQELTSREASSGPETRGLNLGQGEMLSAGSQTSEQVTRLQEMLNGSGSQLEVDGVFGPRTAEAVRRFQEAHNLTVDGIVGPQTLAALNGGGQGAPSDEGQTQPSAEAVQDGGTGSAQQSATGSAQQGAAGTAQQSAIGSAQEGAVGSAQQSAADAVGPDQQAAETHQPVAGGSTSRLEGLPPRPENARGGREFMESISRLPPGRQRDQAVLQEILSGNIPDNLRTMQEVVVNRGGHEIRMQATPDYLSIGSNEDNVRVPMTPGVAQAIADRTGTSLPTDRMVDDIHAQARRLHMAPMSDNRSGISTYLQHDQRIDGQLGSGVAPNTLVSGHKKDLVIPARDGQVAIYGGRWSGGGLIQRYSNVHNDSYEDYSHGARLVSRELVIDGRPMSLEAALDDPRLAPLLTNHRSGSFRY